MMCGRFSGFHGNVQGFAISQLTEGPQELQCNGSIHTKEKVGSKAKKIKQQAKKDQSTKNKHERKFSLSLRLTLGVSRP